YTDTLLTHLALPDFYIQENSTAPYPYHLHSYFPQNLEMIVVWCLLLKSEVAASLCMAAVLVAFAGLIAGFLYRRAGGTAAIASVFIFISAPICVLYGSVVKNDVPMALFLFAHYAALTEALDRMNENPSAARPWIFLSGLLCGGAIGT